MDERDFLESGIVEGVAESRRSSGEKIRLSFIIGARNDGYMVNFNWRLGTTLNYLANNLRRLGRLEQVEVVVADWGSEVPLHTVLCLNDAAKHVVRFILVPPDKASRLQRDSEFPIVLAQNVAVRRSRGEYIAQTDSDILFPEEFFEHLFAMIDGHQTIQIPVARSLLVSRRRQVPWSYTHHCPSMQELDWFIHRLGCLLPIDRMFPADRLELYTATGFAMMHRSLWQECRGYDEGLLHWGWMDVDLALRVTRKYPWMFLDRVGIPFVFHLEHYPPSSGRETTRQLNPTKCDSPLRVNGEAWGLGGEPLEEFVFSSADIGSSGVQQDNDPKPGWNTRSILTVLGIVTAAFFHRLQYGLSSRDAHSYAKYFSDCGKKRLRAGKIREARRYFRRALSYQPLYGKNLRRWILSLLPGIRDLYISRKKKLAGSLEPTVRDP